ncbi:TIGR04255 family protein [Cronobacter sakazakii]|nr:TIGR04255 family protein [Cronobacter sakazakii]KAB1063630.1 TIGR04255 family protein [Cronobacter sakazakii]
MAHVTPHNEHNAIKNVAFALEFSDHIAPEVVRQAIDIYKSDKELSQGLPRMVPMEALTFQVNGNFGTQSLPSKSLSGVTFDRLKENGDSKWAVIIRPDAFIVLCNEYTHWGEIVPQAIKYINKLIPAFEGIAINVIGLEFVDEFFVDDLNDSKWLDELFNPDSSFLSPHLKKKASAWHLHSGHWEKINFADKVYLSLINSFIDCQTEDEIERDVVRIRHMQKIHLNEDVLASEVVKNDRLEIVYGQAHTINLAFVSDLLSKKMKEMINMGAK